MGRRKNYPWDSRVDKQMTNLISGILTGVIITPFVLLDLASKSAESAPTEYDSFKQKKITKHLSVYNKLISDLSKDPDVKKLDYSNIIQSSTKIKERIEELYRHIFTYKSRAKRFGFITKMKEGYIKKMRNAYQEIHSLEVYNKIPVLIDDSNAKNNGYVYLSLNGKINSGKRINTDKLARKKNKIEVAYAINKIPILSLQFDPIELYLFDDAVAIITKDDYIFIDGNTILAEYRTIPLEMRFINYHIVEMGVLELAISTQKINLLFTNTKYGYSIYKTLIGN